MLVPLYDSDYRMTLTHELYVNKDLEKSYSYQIIARGLMWIGTPLLKPLLPSEWTFGVFDADSRNTAIIGTALAFWQEAHEDGFF